MDCMPFALGADEYAFLIVDASLAFLAVFTNFYVSLRVTGKLRWLLRCISILAIFYVISYLWLILVEDDLHLWGNMMLRMQAAALIAPWSALPVVVYWHLRDRAQMIVAKAEEQVARYGPS